MEKYEEAAESRFDDWEILSKGENRRKACSIHLGGIYIECLLKGMLCSQCSVTAGTNISQWIINGHTQKRPGHGLNINIYTSYLSDVYDDMSEDMLRRSRILVVCGSAVDDTVLTDIAIANRFHVASSTMRGVLGVDKNKKE